MNNRMHKRNIVVFLLLIVIMLLINGCWSRKELNQISLVSAMGIDYVDDEYEVTFQVINPEEVAGTPAIGPSTGETPVAIYQMRAPSLLEAIRKTSTKVPRRIYMSDLQLVVFGEELAEKGIFSIVDGLTREEKLRPNFYIFTAKDFTAAKILQLLPPLEKIPAQFIKGTMETTEEVWGSIQGVTVFMMAKQLGTAGMDLALPGITLKGDIEEGDKIANLQKSRSPAYMNLEGLAVYQADRLVGWLDDQESRGYSFVNQYSPLKSTVISMDCGDDDIINVSIYNNKAEIELNVDGPSPLVTYSIKTQGKVAEFTCPEMNLDRLSTIKELELKTAHEIKSMIEATIARSKQLNSDIFGIGSQFRKKEPKFWKTYEDQADNLLNDVEFEVNVDVNIRHTGAFSNPALQEWMK